MNAVNVLEVPGIQHEQPIEAPGPHSPDESLRDPVRLGA
jgi:hypothetical protein